MPTRKKKAKKYRKLFCVTIKHENCFCHLLCSFVILQEKKQYHEEEHYLHAFFNSTDTEIKIKKNSSERRYKWNFKIDDTMQILLHFFSSWNSVKY